MISFGDDAFKMLVQFANRIPIGYVVGLGSGVNTIDGEWHGCNYEVVSYRLLDEDGKPTGECLTMPWTDVESLHVY